MNKRITFLSLFYIFILGLLIPSFAQPTLIPNTAPQINLDEPLQRKIVSHKLVSDIRQGLFNNLSSPDALEEEKVGVVIYFENFPSSSEITELENLGINCYTNTWIPPLENHPYGFILAKLPPSQLNNALSKSFIKKMDSSTHEAYPNNNLGTAAIAANSVWAEGYDGSGVKIAVLDSGLDPFYEGTDLPTGYERLDCWQYPITDNIVDNAVSGHGTHVTGSVLGRGALSASNTGNGGGAYKGSAPGADLVFLKIGGDITSNATSAAMIGAMQEAVNTFDADILTMSYGGWYEHHDGSSATEQTVDWVYDQGKPFFISAGNEGGSGRHYSGTVAAGSETGVIEVTVTGAGTNNTALFFNLVWSDGPANNNLSLKYYNSSMVELTSVTNEGTIESSRGTESNFSNYNNYVLPGNSTYYLKVVNSSGVEQDFHIYDRWGSRVKFASSDPFYTIGQPASADNACAVGAYNTREDWTASDGVNRWFGAGTYTVGDIAWFSSRGPRIDGTTKPEITAPGALILSLRDTDVYTAFSTNWVDNDGTIGPAPYEADANYYRMQGTSMACPLAAGAAALYLQYNPDATPQEVYEAIITNATEDSFTGTVPNSTFGNGKLNIYNAIYDGHVELEVVVYLEGAFTGGTPPMSTALFPDIPTSQPFNVTPWFYDGTESLDPIPSNFTDWVLVELRDDKFTPSPYRKAALVNSFGGVYSFNGSPLKIMAPEGDYWIVVHQRNHLSVMSSDYVSLTQVAPPTPPVVISSNTQLQPVLINDESKIKFDLIR